MKTFTENALHIFAQLNAIPRASHHEEQVADFLCRYAEGLGLEYDRDAENCVVIRKAATPGHEAAPTVVLLNHMDMVAVGDGSRPFDPLADGIEAYTEDGWMKARGTSLGADNGIGLSMALAVLADDSLVHPALEVLTTTNEEDGMSGAAGLSTTFIHGRKVINLDSEDYDTITVGAAGAYLQTATIPLRPLTPPPSCDKFYKVAIRGGLGGHSGVDINKHRINAISELCHFLRALRETDCASLCLAEICGGDANASIPSHCAAIVGISSAECESFEALVRLHEERIRSMYDEPLVGLTVEETAPRPLITSCDILYVVDHIPCGVLRMRDDMPGTVMTSNNIGIIRTETGSIHVSCHTRSFSDEEMVRTAEDISRHFEEAGADVCVVMNTPGWQENTDSAYLALVDQAFVDVLHFSPRKVAMHFVLEAGYYVQKYPGIEIACIGPRIVEPHSTKERVELSTVDDICRVLVVLLSRLA